VHGALSRAEERMRVLDHGEAGDRTAGAVVAKMFAGSAPSVRLVHPDVPDTRSAASRTRVAKW
jgi:hypothetical protein